MKLLISPAKKMRVDRDFLPPETTPVLVEQSALLLEELRKLSYPQLKKLLACNDTLAQEAFGRVQEMGKRLRGWPMMVSNISIWLPDCLPRISWNM